MNTLLISLAVLPVVVLAIFIYRRDRFAKEPIGMLLKAFLLGALCCLPAGFTEGFLILFAPADPVGNGLFTGFVVAGFTEELFKMLCLALTVWGSRHFDEYFDGVVYATFVSLGFACVENIGYVLGQETLMASLGTGVVRALLSVPGHFLFGVAMGYFFGRARFEPKRRARHLVLALLVPILLHGTFDAILMVNGNLKLGLLTPLLAAFIVFDIFMWVLATRRLRRLQELTQRQGQMNVLKNLEWNLEE